MGLPIPGTGSSISCAWYSLPWCLNCLSTLRLVTAGIWGITLALSFLALLAWEKGRKDVSLLVILATGWSDWSFLAPVFTIMVHQTKRERKQEALAFGAGTFLFALICLANGESVVHALGFGLAGVLRIYGYNGEKGNFPGWLFYGFYPIHLLLLAGIAG